MSFKKFIKKKLEKLYLLWKKCRERERGGCQYISITIEDKTHAGQAQLLAHNLNNVDEVQLNITPMNQLNITIRDQLNTIIGD